MTKVMSTAIALLSQSRASVGSQRRERSADPRTRMQLSWRLDIRVIVVPEVARIVDFVLIVIAYVQRNHLHAGSSSPRKIAECFITYPGMFIMRVSLSSTTYESL